MITVYIELFVCFLLIIAQTNTFQAIIITDVFKTYVIYTYKCGELEWSGPDNGYAVVGYNLASGNFINHPLSNRREVNTIACQNLPSTDIVNIVYSFEANSSKILLLYNEK